jgi:hypothetical protein
MLWAGPLSVVSGIAITHTGYTYDSSLNKGCAMYCVQTDLYTLYTK